MRSSKELKSFTRSIVILILTLHAFVLQSFTPTLSQSCSHPCGGNYCRVGEVCISDDITIQCISCNLLPSTCVCVDLNGCNYPYCCADGISIPRFDPNLGRYTCCPELSCFPSAGCSYNNPIYNIEGCLVDCGILSCNTSSSNSSSSSGGGNGNANGPVCDTNGIAFCARGTPRCSMGLFDCVFSGTDPNGNNIFTPLCVTNEGLALPYQPSCVSSSTSSSSSSSSGGGSGSGNANGPVVCDANGMASCAVGTPRCSMGVFDCVFSGTDASGNFIFRPLCINLTGTESPYVPACVSSSSSSSSSGGSAPCRQNVFGTLDVVCINGGTATCSIPGYRPACRKVNPNSSSYVSGCINASNYFIPGTAMCPVHVTCNPPPECGSSGCSYQNPRYDAQGCQFNCGTLSCNNTSSSSGGSGSNANSPICDNNNSITCRNGGRPTCNNNDRPNCRLLGSNLSTYTPGCDHMVGSTTFFRANAAFCSSGGNNTSGCRACPSNTTCMPGEVLVPRTCTECAYCRPGITSCIQCPPTPTCRPDQILVPKTCKSCAYCASTTLCIQCFTTPTCRPGQVLVPKTCTRCAYCTSGATSCIQCPPTPTCRPGQVLIPKTCTRCAYCTTPVVGSGPTCDADDDISCASGTPTCNSGTAICGSKLGLSGSLAGPGCNNTGTGFNPGTAFCSDNNTTSSSGTTSGCIQCFTTPTCRPGQTLVPKTCTQCAYCTSGSTSSPTCVNKVITCASGTPTCSMGTAICGSQLGLMGAQAGPGCSSMGSFNPNAAFCSGTSTSSTRSSTTSSCVQCISPIQTCRLGEELVPTTCTQCAYCTPSSTSSPTCDSTHNIMCQNGTPTCSTGIAICGSKLGLRGSSAGPGCSSRGSFNPGAAFCSGNSIFHSE